jgi:FAD/FMN-containing dehydrogenase
MRRWSDAHAMSPRKSSGLRMQTADAAVDAHYIEWARDTAAAVEPWSVSGGYVNYMQADEPIERVRAGFGDEAFGRLQALKRRYDPNNVLRRNQNIPPQ